MFVLNKNLNNFMGKKIFKVLLVLFLVLAPIVILIGCGIVFEDQRLNTLLLNSFGGLELFLLGILLGSRFIPKKDSRKDSRDISDAV